MVAGNTNTLATKAYCHRQYWMMRNSQLYWTLQNTWTYPKAQAYVDRLFREAPTAKEPFQGQLVVITNITGSGSSYYVAEELALNAGMHLVLLSKKKEKLRSIEENLLKEAKRRGVQANQNYKRPTIFKVQYDPHSLKSVMEAAQEVIHISAGEAYQSKLPILLHNPSGVTMEYQTTAEGVEVNVGRNFMAPHILTQQLLPLLKATATTTFKPRIIYVSSVGHCQGNDFDPDRFLLLPEEGGAPEGTLVAPGGNSGQYEAAATGEATTKEYKQGEELDGCVTMYYRSKMAVIADAMALAMEEPSLAPVSVYPGSVAATQKKSLGIAEAIYQKGFYMFNLSPRQAARASLRAALDPDLNTGELPTGSYLHCDGNPWTAADPTIDDPVTGVSYELVDYAKKVRDCALKLTVSLLERKDNNEEAEAVAGEGTDRNEEGVNEPAQSEPDINVQAEAAKEENKEEGAG